MVLGRRPDAALRRNAAEQGQGKQNIGGLRRFVGGEDAEQIAAVVAAREPETGGDGRVGLLDDTASAGDEGRGTAVSVYPGVLCLRVL